MFCPRQDAALETCEALLCKTLAKWHVLYHAKVTLPVSSNNYQRTGIRNLIGSTPLLHLLDPLFRKWVLEKIVDDGSNPLNSPYDSTWWRRDGSARRVRLVRTGSRVWGHRSGLWTEWNTSPWNSCSSVARLNANLCAQECKCFAGTLKFWRLKTLSVSTRRTPHIWPNPSGHSTVNRRVLTLTGHNAACLYWSGSWDVWNVCCNKNCFML